MFTPVTQGDLAPPEVVETLAAQEHVVIICGHYEGLDERFVSSQVDREISMGDFCSHRQARSRPWQ